MSRSPRTPRLGVLYAVLSATLFGFGTPLAKWLLEREHPAMAAGLLYLGAGFGLGLYALVRRVGSRGRPAKEAALARRDLPWLLGAAALGGVAGPLLLFAGLRATPASTASLLLNLEGVFTALLAWHAFRENFDRRVMAGMGCIVVGGALLAWPGQGGVALAWGVPAIAAACLAWAVDNNLTQKVSAADPVTIVIVKGTVAGTVNLGIAAALGAHLPPATVALATLAVGFVSYGSSLLLFVLALRHLGTARTGAYYSIAPFVGAAVALVFLREPISGLFVPAAALMAVGVWLHLSERHGHEHAHATLTHAHRHRHDEHHRHDHLPGTVVDDESHAHEHTHEPMRHTHPHTPDLHHRHDHDHPKKRAPE